MKTKFLHRKILGTYCAIITGVLFVMLFWVSTITSAQQPTVIISELKGNVQVSIQGGKSVVAEVGLELQAGDRIETQAGAEVILILSDGSELQLSENTNLDLTVLQLVRLNEMKF